MGKIIAICNQKGGVGKTTTSIALAAALTRLGKKVLAIDCDDGNAGLTKSLGYDPDKLESTLTDLLMFQNLRREVTELLRDTILTCDEEFDVIPSDNELPLMTNTLASSNRDDKNEILLKVLEKVKENYDYVIIDTAPTLNTLSLNTLTAADEVVIVTQSQDASESAIGVLIQTIIDVKQRSNPGIIIRGLLITMIDNRTKYEKETANNINNTYSDLGMKVFQSKIPRAVAAAKCVKEKKSIISYDKNSTVAKAYMAFAQELLNEEE